MRDAIEIMGWRAVLFITWVDSLLNGFLFCEFLLVRGADGLPAQGRVPVAVPGYPGHPEGHARFLPASAQRHRAAQTPNWIKSMMEQSSEAIAHELFMYRKLYWSGASIYQRSEGLLKPTIAAESAY